MLLAWAIGVPLPLPVRWSAQLRHAWLRDAAPPTPASARSAAPCAKSPTAGSDRVTATPRPAQRAQRKPPRSLQDGAPSCRHLSGRENRIDSGRLCTAGQHGDAAPLAPCARPKRPGAPRTARSTWLRNRSWISRAPAASMSAAGTKLTVVGTSSTRRSVRAAVLVIAGSNLAEAADPADAADAADAAGAGGTGAVEGWAAARTGHKPQAATIASAMGVLRNTVSSCRGALAGALLAGAEVGKASWLSGLLRKDQLAEGSQAQSIDRLAVFDLDFVPGAEEFGAAPATSRRSCRGLVWRRHRRRGRRSHRRFGRAMNGAGGSHRSGDGRRHRNMVVLRSDGDAPALA